MTGEKESNGTVHDVDDVIEANEAEAEVEAEENEEPSTPIPTRQSLPRDKTWAQIVKRSDQQEHPHKSPSAPSLPPLQQQTNSQNKTDGEKSSYPEENRKQHHLSTHRDYTVSSENCCELVGLDFKGMLQNIHAKHVGIDAMSPGAPEQVNKIDSIANLTHGRIGEELANNYFEREFPSEDWDVVWCNEFDETYKPFDFIIKPNAKKRYGADDDADNIDLKRFVEVKTRVSDQPISQWFISLKELSTAIEKAQQENVLYSCLLIHLKRNKQSEFGYDVRMFWVNDLSAKDEHVDFLIQLKASKANK
jgi:hypothetical protein